MTEGINLFVRQTTGDEVEGEVEVGEGEEGEHELDELIDKFDVQENFAGDSVVSVPDLAEVNKGVDSGEESSVQPSTSLGDELRDSV